MKKAGERSSSGVLLVVVAAAAIMLVLLGVGIFLLMRLVGSGREVANACDAGALAVAKEAILRPAEKLAAGLEMANFRGLGDANLDADGNTFNLKTYNRAVGKVLLVAVNARNQRTKEALAHAEELANVLQGPGSLGARLKEKLEARSQNKLFEQFLGAGAANSLRMLGGNTLAHADSEFACAYMERPDRDDPAATNLEIDPGLQEMLPPELVTRKLVHGVWKSYFRGYVDPKVSHIPVIGVPVQPGDQPHLVSGRDFSAQKTLAFAGAFVPPNAFACRGQASMNAEKLAVAAVSQAKVGVLDSAYKVSMPLGYIAVRNGPNFGKKVAGPFLGLDHTLNNELLPPGIEVESSTKIFSQDRELLQEWIDYNNDPADHTKPTRRDTEGGPFKANGQPAKDGELAKMRGSLVNCQDSDVTGDPVKQPCQELFEPKANGAQGAFDRAYHPGGGFTEPGRADKLMAIECAKCRVQALFMHCGSVTADGCGPTGMKVYRPRQGPYYGDPAEGKGCASKHGERCIMADPGSVKDLFEQTERGALAARVLPGRNGLASRIRQIKPEATDDEIDRVLSSGKLLLGERMYIYMTSEKTRTLVMTNSAPPGMLSKDEAADGEPVPVARHFYLSQTAMNPPHDDGIHEIMFREHEPLGVVDAVETCKWTPSSGFNNLLGVIEFNQDTHGTAHDYCKPN